MGGALARAANRVRGLLALSESHVWYALDLDGERPQPALAGELTLRLAVTQDLPRLEGVQANPLGELTARLGGGNEMWLVLEGEDPLFSCWIFRGCTPVAAAPGGELSLPPDTVCLEDSETAAGARGRGIAPAAWARIAGVLEQEGKRWLITKVATDNAASRRAVEKAGFEPVALMHFRRTGPRSRTTVEPEPAARAGTVGAYLAAALSEAGDPTAGSPGDAR